MYLRALVKRQKTKENLNPIFLQKKMSNEYFFTDQVGDHQTICKTFLLKCLQITPSRLSRAINSSIQNEAGRDHRGQHFKRKTNDADIDFLITFIKRFPVYESHYSSKTTNTKYLSPFLNIRRMYREYKLVCDFEKRKLLTEWKFREIFNTKFNLSFHPLVIDSCKKCDIFKAAMDSPALSFDERERLLVKKNDHLATVRLVKKEFEESIKLARMSDAATEVLTFDLQRALELPSIKTNEAYYKRQLWVYNLCIYDEVRRKGYMYVWNESIASRGAQEIGSCLFRHLSSHVPQNTEKIILYSDACGGQNRNIKCGAHVKKILSRS